MESWRLIGVPNIVVVGGVIRIVVLIPFEYVALAVKILRVRGGVVSMVNGRL
jgi:uncharacterized membrane protein